jgi:acyl-coenzyme A synthetase/AMP-(fatty) acid ligase
VDILDKLKERWKGIDYPFLVHSKGELRFSEIAEQDSVDLSDVCSGDVVALIGDFDPKSILSLLQLIDKNVILVPLTIDTRAQHEYFFESALVDVVIEGDSVKRINHDHKHEFIEHLRNQSHAGLVLLSTGTTGRPKAILHDSDFLNAL